MPRYKLKRWFILLLIPLSFFLIIWAKGNPQWVEAYYSRTFYAGVSSAMSIITGLAQFSIAEVIIVLLLIGLLFAILLFILKVAQLPKGKRAYQFYLLFANGMAVLSVLCFLFVILCRLNYYRVPLEETLGLEIDRVSSDQVYRLAEDLIVQANGQRPYLQTDEKGTVMLSRPLLDTMIDSQKAMTYLSRNPDFSMLEGIYSQPKGARFSRMLTAFGLRGYFFCYTYEANVNIDVPAYLLPATMTHELSHVRGYMGEDEANFLAYLACMESPRDDFHYSGTMMVLEYALYEIKQSGDVRYVDLLQKMSPEVRKDFQQNADYWEEHNGILAGVGRRFNDLYLKSGNEGGGNNSYAGVIQLLISYKGKLA